MRILSPLPALTELLLLSLLSSSGAQGDLTKLQVWVHPPNPVILSGSSIIVNCSSNCADSAGIGLETGLVKNVESSGTNWKAFRLSNVTQDNSPLCFDNCQQRSQGSTRANITVYEPPKNLELNLEPSQDQCSPPCIPVGQNITLSCHVAGGRPRQNLELVLLQGTQKISRQPAPENTLDTVVVKFPITASRQDGETSFSCQAQLDLRPRGLELYESSSAPLKFYTFDLAPKPPNLTTPKILEVGTKTQVSCEMDKLFPVEKAHMQLSWGGQRLIHHHITRQGDVLRATATITAEEKGDRELTCNVTLGNEIRKLSKDVTVYNLSEPDFMVSEPIKEGSLVNLTCQANPPARVVIEGMNETERLSLIAQEKDNGRLFTCHAILELRGETLNKSRTLKLNVLFPPKLDEGCPRNWNWTEGTEQTLQCTARGNPAPTVNCVLENKQKEIPIGIPQMVSQALNGTYLCTANNSLGEANTSVSVVVILKKGVDLTPILTGILVSLVVLGFLGVLGYIYYRQQRIRSYELKKAQEARAMQPIKPEAKLCP